MGNSQNQVAGSGWTSRAVRWFSAVCRVFVAAVLFGSPAADAFAATPVPVEVVEVVNLTANPGQTVKQVVEVEKGRMVTIHARTSGRSAFMVQDKEGKLLQGLKPIRYYTGEYEMSERRSIYPVQTDELHLIFVGWGKEPAKAEVTVEYDRGFQMEPYRLDGQMWKRQTRVPMATFMMESGTRIVGEDNEFKASCEFIRDGGMKTLTIRQGACKDLGVPVSGIFGLPLMPNYIQPFLVRYDGKTTYHGMLIERSVEYQHFVKQPDVTPEFVGLPDISLFDGDGDALAEALAMEVRVKLGLNEEATVHARLVDSEGFIIHPDVTATARNPVGFEDVPVRLFVKAEQLVRTARPGPWTFTDIRLWHPKTDFMVDRMDDQMAQTYSMGMFKAPEAPTIMSVTASDKGIVTIMGTNVGDAKSVTIDGHECQHAALGMDRIQVIPQRKTLTLPEWQEVCNRIDKVRVKVVTEWGEAVRP